MIFLNKNLVWSGLRHTLFLPSHSAFIFIYVATLKQQSTALAESDLRVIKAQLVLPNGIFRTVALEGTGVKLEDVEERTRKKRVEVKYFKTGSM